MPEFVTKRVSETTYLYVAKSCSMDPGDISHAMGEGFQAVWTFMQDHGITPSGPALSVYYTYDPEVMNFRAGFCVADGDLSKAAGRIRGGTIPATEALHFVHKGSYATLRDDYGVLMQHTAAEGLAIGAPSWEIYMNDPATTSEDMLVTEVYVSLA